jgi:hypothetical protein
MGKQQRGGEHAVGAQKSDRGSPKLHAAGFHPGFLSGNMEVQLVSLRSSAALAD